MSEILLVLAGFVAGTLFTWLFLENRLAILRGEIEDLHYTVRDVDEIRERLNTQGEKLGALTGNPYRPMFKHHPPKRVME